MTLAVFLATSCGSPIAGSRSPTVASPPRTTTPTANPSMVLCPNATCPPVRAGLGSAFDESRGAIVMFGGNLYPANLAALSETWEWTAGGWKQLHPVISPSPRNDPAMTFVPGIGVLLYGGSAVADSSHPVRVEGGQINLAVDTWMWDGDSWTELQPVHTPQLWKPTMAYDRNRHQVLLYGLDRSALDWQTWAWDGNDWTAHSGSTASPNPGRWVAGTIGYDPAVGEVTLFGGLLNSPASTSFDRTAVWAWDGDRWTNLPVWRAPSAISTQAIDSAALASEPVSGRMVIYANDLAAGTTTWAWNGTAWSNVNTQPQPRVNFESRLFADPLGRRSVLFGQVYTGPLTSTPNPDDSWYEVWSWDGSSWAQLG